LAQKNYRKIPWNKALIAANILNIQPKGLVDSFFVAWGDFASGSAEGAADSFWEGSFCSERAAAGCGGDGSFFAGRAGSNLLDEVGNVLSEGGGSGGGAVVGDGAGLSVADCSGYSTAT